MARKGGAATRPEPTSPAARPWSERLTPLDAMFLDLEDASVNMHVGGLMVLEGEPPPLDALRLHLWARLDRVPRYRQVLATVPLHLGRPAWVDAPAIDLAHHVRAHTLPAEGEAALAARAGAFLAEPLDRARPLWGLELVSGLGGGRFALLSRTHHCVLDGVAGVGFLQAITDPSPEAAASAPAPWQPRPAPGAAARLASGLAWTVQRPIQLCRQALTPGTDGRRIAQDLWAGVRPLLALAVGWPAPRTALDGRVGPGRSWAGAALPLPRCQAVRAARGGTLNDVLLAVVAGALRAVLGQGGPPPAELRAFVPVSVRRPEARAAPGNQVALVFCRLPVGEPDPAARLCAIAAETRRLKETRSVAGILAFEDLGELAPAPLAAQAARAAVAMHHFNLVVSNVPGPREVRWLLGRRLLACHPAIPLARGQRLAVGAMSYGGALAVGVQGGSEQGALVQALAAALLPALQELEA
ncbi:MAG: wax ester/triacylglycerol synthase family O-acyltransferase [Anaeromyxobacter sp.]